MAEIQNENTNIYYDISGKGIPIIFIHPPAMGRIVFRNQWELNRYFCVIFPDLSGNGDSIGPEKQITIHSYAEEIVALLDRLRIEKAVICGYSAGASVAQEFALSFPQRTLGLILISGYPEVLSLAFKYEHIIGMYLVKRFPNFLTQLIASSHTDDDCLQDEIIQHMKKANRNMWSQWYEQSLHYSCLNKLPELSVPTLLIYGGKDLANQHIRAYKKFMNFEAVIIPDIAHQLPIKKSKIINQSILGFIYEQIMNN